MHNAPKGALIGGVMSKLELNIIRLFYLVKADSISTWHLTNLIYFDCMSKKDKRNGGRVSAICRAAKRSNFLKLECGTVHFKKEGWPDKPHLNQAKGEQ